MTITTSFRIATLSLTLSLLSACTIDKLEARLQADPECKAVMSPKTGSLMPCPGTDKAFYKSIPALSQPIVQPSQAPMASSANAVQSPVPQAPARAAVECKPQIHQKSGSLMPCPAP